MNGLIGPRRNRHLARPATSASCSHTKPSSPSLQTVPHHFQDIMTQRHAFKSFAHDHYFDRTNPTALHSHARRTLRFAAPLGPLGWIAEKLVLRSYLSSFLIDSGTELIKQVAEGSEKTWSRFIEAVTIHRHPIRDEQTLRTPSPRKDHTQGPDLRSLSLSSSTATTSAPPAATLFPIVEQPPEALRRQTSASSSATSLSPMHPYAEHAAETAEFAAAHDKFWEMHALLYKHQRNLSKTPTFSNSPSDLKPLH